MGWLGRKGVRSLAKKMDDWYVNGSGSGEPRGIRIAENVNSVAQEVAGDFGWTDVVELEMALPQQHRPMAAFVLNDTGLKLIRKAATTTGEPAFVSPGDFGRLGISTDYKNSRGMIRLPGAEYPYFIVSASALPNNLGAGANETEIWFGVLANYRIWAAGEMEMSQDSAGENFRKGQTQVKLEVREDGVVVLGESFAKLTGVLKS